MSDTKIEWTRRPGTIGATWNPLTGCDACSAGCANCYAARMTYRLEMMGQAKYAGLTVLQPNGRRHFNGVVRPDPASLEIPLHWKSPRTVFVNSMSDLFYGDDADRRRAEAKGQPFNPVPFEFIDKVFAVMNATMWRLPLPANLEDVKPWHTYLVLTKRTGRMAKYMLSRARKFPLGEHPLFKVRRELFKGHGIHVVNASACLQWPPSNVWIGTSVENQAAADVRVPELLRCPIGDGAVRFISQEPQIGDVEYRDEWASGLDWIICGGESGPGARPFDIAWARRTRDWCHRHRRRFFMKQMGARIRIPNDSHSEWPREGDGLIYDERVGFDYQGELHEVRLNDRKGGDPSEWPADLNIREFPN